MTILDKKKRKDKGAHVSQSGPDMKIHNDDPDWVKDRKEKYAEWQKTAKKRGAAIRKLDEEKWADIEARSKEELDDIKESRNRTMDNEFIEPPRSSNDHITVNVNVGNGGTQVDTPKREPPIMDDSEDIPKRSIPTPATKKGLKKEIEGEKARRAAIIKAQKRTSSLERKLNEEREKTEGVRTGEYEPTFCDKHPKVCKTAKTLKTATVVATAPIWGPAVAVEKTMDVAVGGTKKVAGAVSKKSKSKKKTVTTAAKSRKAVPTSISPQKKKAASRPKAATAKRSSAATKTSKTVKNTSRTAYKGKTTSKATKSTPKRKSPRKPRNDWWGAGDAGL